ncbi:hypothetical protein G6O67_004733 [Ophiocordyceps sinensis]|uniref:Uncharacterized protein n=1 Tax=Ophiocordyceps sinensis TaxID=72228 RepID=A0A8H4V5D6_9HYPO|nr:hypothetical protein G6O67_004733 [Ophiocordyceps sinensis]
MCLRTLVEYGCYHQTSRGTTECYNREACSGVKVEVLHQTGDCPQCEGQSGMRSARWCPVGCGCVIM